MSYWYCPKCGLGPYQHYWDKCGAGHPRPKD